MLSRRSRKSGHQNGSGLAADGSKRRNNSESCSIRPHHSAPFLPAHNPWATVLTSLLASSGPDRADARAVVFVMDWLLPGAPSEVKPFATEVAAGARECYGLGRMIANAGEGPSNRETLRKPTPQFEQIAAPRANSPSHSAEPNAGNDGRPRIPSEARLIPRTPPFADAPLPMMSAARSHTPSLPRAPSTQVIVPSPRRLSRSRRSTRRRMKLSRAERASRKSILQINNGPRSNVRSLSA